MKQFQSILKNPVLRLAFFLAATYAGWVLAVEKLNATAHTAEELKVDVQSLKTSREVQSQINASNKEKLDGMDRKLDVLLFRTRR